MADTWMKVEAIPGMTLAQFAEREGLSLLVSERPLPVGSPDRYYARFERCEEKGDGVLIGTYGNGHVPASAADDYARKISLKRLVFNAYGDDRREIDVPRLVIEPFAAPSTGGE